MTKKFLALLVFVLVFAFTAGAFADDSYYVREEAGRRNMNLISVERVKDIAAQRLNSSNLHFKKIELDNEADDYYNGSDFRPVYEFECYSNGLEYEFVVDAVTGDILKFKRDD